MKLTVVRCLGSTRCEVHYEEDAVLKCHVMVRGGEESLAEHAPIVAREEEEEV